MDADITWHQWKQCFRT